MAYLIDKDNVRVGVAYLYWAAYDKTSPLALPDDDIEFGGDWPIGWKGIGATNEGVKLTVEPDIQTIYVEESPTPALMIPERVNITIEADLAEDTLENMLLGFSGAGSITTKAPAAGTPGTKSLTMSNTITVLSAGLEMKVADGFWRRMLIPRNNVQGRTEVSFRRASENRAYGVTLASLSDPEEILIVEKTAEALP